MPMQSRSFVAIEVHRSIVRAWYISLVPTKLSSTESLSSLGLPFRPLGRSTLLGLHQRQLNAWSPQPNLSCFRTPTTPLSFSLAQRPHYNLRPASARSFTVTPPSKQNKKKAEAAPKPVIHPPFSAAQTKARWAPLVCSEVKAMIPLLQSGAVPRRSCGQLQGIFQGCERVMKKFRAETDIGPIEIEAFLLSIWIAVREAKEAYPEFAWKKSFPTLYNIVPPDLDRRAEIETFIPSLPDSHFELPRIPASLRYASSGDEAPPPTKKARHRSPSVAETPPPQASSSRRQLTPPVVERPKPKPIGRGAAVVGRGHQAARSISPDVEEIAPTGNIHAADQAADIDAYVRRTHDMGYLSDHFDEVAEIYPNVVDKPTGGILAPPVAVEKVSSVVVHDATIVPEGHVTFYICSNCATRGQHCISRGLGKRCFACNKGKMSCSLHPSVLQLLIAQERLRPLNNVGSISIMNVLQRVIVARRNTDLHHYLLRNSMLDYDDVLSEACILLEQQRQVLKPDDLASCFENPQDLQTLSTLFARLGIDYGSAMSDLRDRNPPPEVFGLSKDGDVVPEDAAEPETHFYVHGPTQQTVFGEFDRLPAESRQVEERVHRIPAGYDVNAVGPPPAAVLEMRRQSKGKAPSRPFVTPPAAQSSPQRAQPSSDPRVRPTSPVYHQSPSHPESSAQSSRKRQFDAVDAPTVQAPRRVSFQQQAASVFSNDNPESALRRPYATGSLNMFSSPTSNSANVFTAPTTTDSGRRIPLTEQLGYADYEAARRQGEARAQAAAQRHAPTPAPAPASTVSAPVSSLLPSFVPDSERSKWEAFVAMQAQQAAQPAQLAPAPVARSPSPPPDPAQPMPTSDSSFLTKPGSPERQEISFHDLDNPGDDSGAAQVGDMSIG
ncbi:hypothetical protein DFH06DRAFT_1129704 [Mycena polygramma]|nr:hypothetical protein DFH06DRAFT_1129704 [Mycena polygramma]